MALEQMNETQIRDELRKAQAHEIVGKTRSLARKVAEIMSAVSYVPKAGHNDHFNYNFAQEGDVLAQVRPEMAKRNLAMLPNVTAHNVRTVQGKNGMLYVTDLVVVFTLMDGDSGEERTVTVIGQGEDNHDKGANKALTAATKYALLKLFLIPTGADPDADAPQEEVPRAPSGQTRPAPQSERRSPVAAPRTDSGRAVNYSGNLPTMFPNFGGLKGKPIRGAPAKDLEYYSNAARRSLKDPSKARFHDKERANLAAYEAELARRTGRETGDSPNPTGYDEPPPPGDEDAPF